MRQVLAAFSLSKYTMSLPQIRVNDRRLSLQSRIARTSITAASSPVCADLHQRLLICRHKLTRLLEYEHELTDDAPRHRGVTVDASALCQERFWLRREIEGLYFDVEKRRRVCLLFIEPAVRCELDAMAEQVTELLGEASKAPQRARSRGCFDDVCVVS